jgi:hypothetical protein
MSGAEAGLTLDSEFASEPQAEREPQLTAALVPHPCVSVFEAAAAGSGSGEIGGEDGATVTGE